MHRNGLKFEKTNKLNSLENISVKFSSDTLPSTQREKILLKLR